MAKKLMDQNFDSGPGFWAMAQRAQNGLKFKNWTPPTVFELESSSLRVMLTYPRAKNLWNRFLIRAPVFGLWPKTCPKWPKIEKLNSSYSFWARILPFSEYHHLIKPKKFMDQNFNLGPGFWAMAQKAQNGLKFKNWTPPTVFELESSSLRVMLTYPRAKNLWNRLLIWAPFFGLWP